MKVSAAEGSDREAAWAPASFDAEGNLDIEASDDDRSIDPACLHPAPGAAMSTTQDPTTTSTSTTTTAPPSGPAVAQPATPISTQAAYTG